MEEDFDREMKVLVVGNGGVGKTSMIRRFCKGGGRAQDGAARLLLPGAQWASCAQTSLDHHHALDRPSPQASSRTSTRWGANAWAWRSMGRGPGVTQDVGARRPMRFAAFCITPHAFACWCPCCVPCRPMRAPAEDDWRGLFGKGAWSSWLLWGPVVLLGEEWGRSLKGDH
jgi:hypothetical protein